MDAKGALAWKRSRQTRVPLVSSLMIAINTPVF